MLHQQAWSFVIAFFAGVVTGVLFDLYRVVRKVIRLRKMGTLMGDVMIWLVAALIIFTLLLIGNWAELRLYVLIALLMGFALYIRILSKNTQRFWYELLYALVKLIKLTITGLLLPLKGIKGLILYLWGIMGGIAGLLIRVAEYLLTFPYIALWRGYKRVGRRTPPGA